MLLEDVLRIFDERGKCASRYVIYGAGLEMHKFMYQNPELDGKIEYYIDQNYIGGSIWGRPVLKMEEAPDLENYGIIVADVRKQFEEIRIFLEHKGLKEFYDFVWCYVIGKKLTLINANCHGHVLLKYLRYSHKFCNEYFVYPLPEIHLNKDKEIKDDLIKFCEIYIHQDIQKENPFGYKLSDEYILPRLNKKCQTITIPNFVEMARWLFPAQGKGNSIFIGSRHISWYDKVLEKGWLMGLNKIDDYISLYNGDEYSAKEMQLNFERDIEKLKTREKKWDIVVSDYILNNFRSIPCFMDARHPSIYLMAYIGKKLAEILKCYDIIDDSSFFDDTGIRDTMGIPLPLLGCVKRYFNISYIFKEDIRSGIIEDYYPENNDKCVRKMLSIDEYIKSYMWCAHGLRLE